MSIFNPESINQELIDKLKKAHPGKKLFKWSQLGVIYTPITRELNDKILKLSNDIVARTGNLPVREVEDMVVTECVLYPKLTPEDRKEIPVGTYTTLNKVIHEKSGYIEVDVFGRSLCRDSFSEPLVDFTFWEDATEEQVEKVKASCPYSLYKVYIGEFAFVIRQLSRKDVELTQDKQDHIFEKVKRVTLWPEDINWDSVPSGIIDTLFDEVRNLSGYMENRVTIEEL